jgi:hypothetical protein
MEAWDFIVAGGGLYNNLDYSFTVGYEDGTFAYPDTQPGGGTASLRKQLRILRDFIYGFDFVKMRPDNSIIKEGVPQGMTARALVERGKAYAIYLRTVSHTRLSAFARPKPSETILTVELPAGEYAAEWVNTKTGAIAEREEFKHDGGARKLTAPDYKDDIALRVKR